LWGLGGTSARQEGSDQGQSPEGCAEATWGSALCVGSRPGAPAPPARGLSSPNVGNADLPSLEQVLKRRLPREERVCRPQAAEVPTQRTGERALCPALSHSGPLHGACRYQRARLDGSRQGSEPIVSGVRARVGKVAARLVGIRTAVYLGVARKELGAKAIGGAGYRRTPQSGGLGSRGVLTSPRLADPWGLRPRAPRALAVVRAEAAV